MGNGCYRSFVLLSLLYLFIDVLVLRSAAVAPISTPLNCTDTSRLCASFLAFKPTPEQTLPVIMSMFDVLQYDISYEGNGENYVFIRKNCSCSWGGTKYLTNTTLTVKQENGSLYDLVMNSYRGLAYLPHKFRRGTKKGAVVSFKLLCGCSNGLWNYLMSYVMKDGDSVASLASRFGVSMSSIETVNNLPGPDNFTIGSLYYIPLDSVPGQLYPANVTFPGPAPSPSVDVVVEPHENRKNHAPFWWIIGSLGFGFVLFIGILLYVFFRSSAYSRGSEGNHPRDLNKRSLHKFHILSNASFCCGSGRRMCCSSQDMNHPKGESNNRQINIPAVIRTDVFDVEKPVVFTFDEILSSTEGFSDSSLLGHGTYGSVYFAVLQDQEVAIKKMTATKTKEFMAEMKVLCKVHHTNLVELIGYAATPDELFLVYEYAQKGSLRHHLHEHQGRGHISLSWIMRVQIALDAARGLEYIHEHTKPHYVHRDIKTSNILIDGSFRAKISDFGLAKLIMTTGEESVTRVVGTYGYLAPEYLRDGIATTKCDVYAFGVVLFELISGEEGISRRPERRSLTSIMIAAMKNSTDISSLKDHIDPNLLDLYPHDCLLKMAILARQCVDSDPVLRPNMKQVVISLSHILLSSIEWEATLAGNSQVFSGLVQGR